VATHHRYATVQGHQIFYREAGAESAPAIVLLHGFPTSSFSFRDLIPILAERYHVIAPTIWGSASPTRHRSRSSTTHSMS